MNKLIFFLPLLVLALGCDDNSADHLQSQRQETIQAELAAKMGVPNIKNGAEMRLVKTILEMRDQNLATYTYTYSEMQGKFRFLGNTVGFAVPYATQYTNPQKYVGTGNGYIVLPQADPNGLFSPASAEGSWILMKDPNSDKVEPQYIEPRIATFTFKLPDRLLIKD